MFVRVRVGHVRDGGVCYQHLLRSVVHCRLHRRALVFGKYFQCHLLGALGDLRSSVLVAFFEGETYTPKVERLCDLWKGVDSQRCVVWQCDSVGQVNRSREDTVRDS